MVFDFKLGQKLSKYAKQMLLLSIGCISNILLSCYLTIFSLTFVTCSVWQFQYVAAQIAQKKKFKISLKSEILKVKLLYSVLC